MLIYQAPSERFIDDVRENTISDIMTENYKVRLGKDPGIPEFVSWQNSLSRVRDLLELDWVCVTWDADFRYSSSGWEHKSFVGDRWNNIRKLERRLYLKNAYRVLLTRARQGMVIVVPLGDADDPTRNSIYIYISTTL